MGLRWVLRGRIHRVRGLVDRGTTLALPVHGLRIRWAGGPWLVGLGLLRRVHLARLGALVVFNRRGRCWRDPGEVTSAVVAGIGLIVVLCRTVWAYFHCCFSSFTNLNNVVFLAASSMPAMPC